MQTKIINPYFKTPDEIDADALAPVVMAAMKAQAQQLGQVASLVEIKAILQPAEAAKLSRAVFNIICSLNGWQIINPDGA